ncbi:hypothetical protein E2C01_039589 [Portunus trituberculatus]|uniref:Uncharacterized protein n=1 Tax=Portunus trituberculatus TaxID=210409 RepID=A0A5B7FNF6_PORTR|nr:hypothetical protein [Portunus trituberculatus]
MGKAAGTVKVNALYWRCVVAASCFPSPSFLVGSSLRKPGDRSPCSAKSRSEAHRRHRTAEVNGGLTCKQRMSRGAGLDHVNSLDRLPPHHLPLVFFTNVVITLRLLPFSFLPPKVQCRAHVPNSPSSGLRWHSTHTLRRPRLIPPRGSRQNPAQQPARRGTVI